MPLADEPPFGCVALRGVRTVATAEMRAFGAAIPGAGTRGHSRSAGLPEEERL